MAYDDGLVELLNRNHSYLSNKKVLITGHITSLQVLSQIKDCAQACILTDNFVTAQGLAAVIGSKLEHSSFSSVQRKHLTLIFGDSSDPRVLESLQALDKFDLLVVMLNKNKSLTQKELKDLTPLLDNKGQILLLGANAIGGKSADSLLKGAAKVYKLDSARKCTAFLGKLESKDSIKGPKSLEDVNFGSLKLSQFPGLFSQGQLDLGTHLLLNAMHADLTAQAQQLPFNNQQVRDLSKVDLQTLPSLDGFGPVLDLGCGSGVIGLSLAMRGIKTVLCSDISAVALRATEINAQRNELSDKIYPFACNMLPHPEDFTGITNGLKQAAPLSDHKFQIIATNPPFHEGLERSLGPTLEMIAQAKSRLLPDGCLYLVGNTSLHYELPLRAAFSKVSELVHTTKFTVFKAQV